MALKLTDARNSILEPFKKNRFVFQFGSIPNQVAGINAVEDLGFVCTSVTVPGLQFGEIEMSRLNDKFYAAGKLQFEELNAEFYDYVAGQHSAGQILYDWASSMYNVATGQSAYKSEYSTTATIAQLDPKGGIARLWNIFYIWPKSVKFGESLSSEEDAVCKVSATFRFDYAIKSKDITSDPNLAAAFGGGA